MAWPSWATLSALLARLGSCPSEQILGPGDMCLGRYHVRLLGRLSFGGQAAGLEHGQWTGSWHPCGLVLTDGALSPL